MLLVSADMSGDRNCGFQIYQIRSETSTLSESLFSYITCCPVSNYGDIGLLL